MNDKNITCQIKRSDRPCLICPGYMDLIEAKPPKFNLFGGMSFVCNSEGFDCLDCPKCGFQTTVADYQYLSMCKKSGKGNFINTRMNSSSDRRKGDTSKRSRSGQRRESNIIRSSISSSGRNCSSCQAPLDSSDWKFCPKCGEKCPSPAPEPVSARRRESVNGNGVPLEIPKDIIIRDSNSSVTRMDESLRDTRNREKLSDSNSIEDGIVRTVTPPTLTSANIDYLGPVEMQY